MNKTAFKNKFSPNGPSFQPLYKQVEDHVRQLIIEQRWKLGEVLPNEFKLAEEFNVSQGTVRKALNCLTEANVLERKQGVGTYISEHTEKNALYRFFPLVSDEGKTELPSSEVLTLSVQITPKEVADELHLKANEEVIFLARKREINGEICILEDIYLPVKYFKGFVEEPEIPHTLYHFYQTKYLHSVQETSDKIKAVLASTEDAILLGINENDPLLMFTRVAKTLDGKFIEYRQTRCRSDKYHYLVNLN